MKKKFPFLLLGNKTDKENQRQVDKQTAETYAKNHGMLFYETSAYSGFNVDEAIVKISSVASDSDTVPYFSPEITNRIHIEETVDVPPPSASGCAC